MLKPSFLLFFLLIFALPVQNQAPILPFAYVITHALNTPETIVMDALSGEILYGFGIDEAVCPISISPNGNWLVYNQDGTKNRMMNLATSEIYPLDDNPLFAVTWSDNGHWAAYLYSFEPNNFVDVRAIPPATESYRVDLEFGGIAPNDFRFIDDTLLTASIPMNTRELVFRSTNLSSSTEQSIEIDDPWKYIDISPNGRFLLGVSLDNIHYSIDLESETIYQLGIAYLFNLYWLPNEPATLVYVGEDGNGGFPLVELSPEGNRTLGELPSALIFSPDSQSAVYKVFDTTDSNLSTLYFLDVASGESREIAYTSMYSSDVRWLSSTQFVYRYVDPASENLNLTDIYLYDTETQEHRQMTDSPDLEERFECYRG